MLGLVLATFRDTDSDKLAVFARFVSLARGNQLHADFFDMELPVRRSAGKTVQRGALLTDAMGIAQSQVQWSVARKVASVTSVAEKAQVMIRLQVSFAGHEIECTQAKNAALAIAHWELSKKV